MAIRANYNGITYAFGSEDGKHYWYMVSGRQIGMIVPYHMYLDIRSAALSQGYTMSDFFAAYSKPRDWKPAKTKIRIPRAEPKEVKIRQSKSSLKNSQKLF